MENLLGLAILLLVGALWTVIWTTVWRRAGYSKGYSVLFGILMLFPLTFFVMLIVLVTKEWPLHREIKELRARCDMIT